MSTARCCIHVTCFVSMHTCHMCCMHVSMCGIHVCMCCKRMFLSGAAVYVDVMVNADISGKVLRAFPHLSHVLYICIDMSRHICCIHVSMCCIHISMCCIHMFMCDAAVYTCDRQGKRQKEVWCGGGLLLKLWVSFAKDPYERDCILQKRPMMEVRCGVHVFTCHTCCIHVLTCHMCCIHVLTCHMCCIHVLTCHMCCIQMLTHNYYYMYATHATYHLIRC